VQRYSAITDPVFLTQQLIKFPSITPQEAGSLSFVSDFLKVRGFSIERLDLAEVSNLYARRGNTSPHLCFIGHVDVVPVNDLARWSVNPFAGEVREGKLYGRGAVDMKGGIGAYLSAIDDYLKENSLAKGSLSIVLTSDEEGPATQGIRYVVEQFKNRKEQIDACIVGEPTNTKEIGDTIKIGRRGSLNAILIVQGKTGHVAYPHLAGNPIPYLLDYLRMILSIPLDHGMPNFDPSHVEVTSIDVGNPTTNVIPAEITTQFNIRFNPLHTRESLAQYLHDKANQAGLTQNGISYTLQVQGSGEAFLCEDQALRSLVQNAVSAITGRTPVLSTGGGTSDARFIKDLSPTIEFGLINTTAHQVDEHIEVEKIHQLASVYQEIIARFFSQAK